MKRILCLILILVMVLCISACGEVFLTEGVGSGHVYYESAENSDTASLKDNASNSGNKNTASKYNGKQNTANSGGFVNNTASKNKSINTFNNSSSDKKVSSGYPTKLNEISVGKSNGTSFKLVGRSSTDAKGLELNWSCSSVEFDLNCAENIDLIFSIGSGSNPVFVEIYVDGKLIDSRTRLDYSGTNVITVATGLNYGIHRVKVVRQSDCECPSLTLTKIRTYGTLVTKAPANNNLYIEFLGDSSQIGWGVRLEDSFFANYNAGEQQSIARNKENEDGTLAYPYIAAEKLGADAYVLARQGAGVAATWHTIAQTIDGQSAIIGNAKAGMLPDMYDYVSINSTTKYEPTRTPDVIVIEAGSADVNSTCLDRVYDNGRVGIDVSCAEQISKEFLLSLKTKNPNTKIIWCYGFGDSSTKLAHYVENVVEGAGGADKGIYTLKLPANKRHGYASSKEHAAAADVLVRKIKQIIR